MKKHADGSPVRRDWAQGIQGASLDWYNGHTPVAEQSNSSIRQSILYWSVFGGKLTINVILNGDYLCPFFFTFCRWEIPSKFILPYLGIKFRQIS